MNCLRIATLLISLYVLYESFCAVAKMPGGLIHFCHKIKYALAFSSSLAFIHYSMFHAGPNSSEWQWLLFGSTGTLAFFVWPRTVFRVKQYFKLIDDFEKHYL